MNPAPASSTAWIRSRRSATPRPRLTLPRPARFAGVAASPCALPPVGDAASKRLSRRAPRTGVKVPLLVGIDGASFRVPRPVARRRPAADLRVALRRAGRSGACARGPMSRRRCGRRSPRPAAARARHHRLLMPEPGSRRGQAWLSSDDRAHARPLELASALGRSAASARLSRAHLARRAGDGGWLGPHDPRALGSSFAAAAGGPASLIERLAGGASPTESSSRWRSRSRRG